MGVVLLQKRPKVVKVRFYVLDNLPDSRHGIKTGLGSCMVRSCGGRLAAGRKTNAWNDVSCTHPALPTAPRRIGLLKNPAGATLGLHLQRHHKQRDIFQSILKLQLPRQLNAALTR